MEWVDGHKVTDQSFLKEHGISPKRLADTVIHCFIKQCLHLGKFHADPHAGNLFVQEDGTLVLIDFGMVSGIDKRDISSLLQLLEGLFFEDYGKVFDALEDLRFLLPSANERELEHAIKTIVDVYMHRTNEINSDLMEEMLREITEVMRRQPIQLPSEFAFLGRAVSVLVGVIYSIDPDIDFLESARPAVHEWIDSDQESIQTSAIDYVKDWAKPFIQFPVLTRDFLKFPDRYLDWERQKQRNQYLHNVYLSRKRYAMLTFLFGIAALFASLFFEKNGLALGCASFSAIALIFYMIAAVKHVRWIRGLKERG
jgi:predicted unusual protein kinase regulating ubiquinone biosynthesis (AarF/ABC1/UbiB family)